MNSTANEMDSPRSSTSSILENVSAKDHQFVDDEEAKYSQLGHQAPKRPNLTRRYLFISGCIVAFLLLVVAGFTAGSSDSNASKPQSPSSDGTNEHRFNLNDYRMGRFNPRTKDIKWIESEKGNQGQYIVNDGGEYYITSWSDKDNKTVILDTPFVEYEGERLVVRDLKLNHQKNRAIVSTDTKKNWRHSTFSRYWIMDVATGIMDPIIRDKHHAELSLAIWSPRGDRVAFIYENNLYLRYVGGENDGKVSQITHDGGEEVFYGRPDWVYEEEVFQGPEALWWSQSGEYLAFLKTNDSMVPEFTIPYYVQNDRELEEYPELVNIKYPKPGFPNPVVEILFLEISTEEHYAVQTESHPVADDLITEVVWAGDKQVIVRMTNRESDLFKLSLVDAKERSGKVVRTHKLNSEEGWFEVTRDLAYVPKDPENDRPEDGYIDTIIVDGFDHLAYFSPLDSKDPKKVLTSGKWEVVDAPSAVDLSTNTVYFIATEKGPVERHLYSVKLDGSQFRAITDVKKDGYYSASFSSDSRFVLLNYAGPEVPWQKVIDLHGDDATVAPAPGAPAAAGASSVVEKGETIEDNKDLKERLEKYQTTTVVHSQIQLDVDSEGNPILGNAFEILPPNFDENKQYAVLFNVYGGPVSQTVSKRFNIDFQHVIASQDVVVVSVDGRGTGKMGRKFRSVVRDKLGYYEVKDQITAAKNWAKRSYVDESRIAIWGWSYGGFMTLKTLEADAGETFNYGMAVAPVTDWRFYDSIYTERYMHTPEHNRDGYKMSRIANVAALAKSERFLVMHGTGDDNVHFQNTLVLLDNLDKKGVENYDVHVFPDSDHSIYHHNANVVVYDKLKNWITDAFNGKFSDLDE